MSVSHALIDELIKAPRYPAVEIVPIEKVLFCLPKIKADLYAEALKLTLPNFSALKRSELLQPPTTQALSAEITGERANKQRVLWVFDSRLFTPAVGAFMAGRNLPYVEIIDYRKGVRGKITMNFRADAVRQFSAELAADDVGKMSATRVFPNVALLAI